ncbi:hypothetical protein [Pontibacter pamirensis]|uniref:hypothetical protein n=1 Tax=Pontibacter pamirensis TaxID=2562824 RepID=UPI00138A3CDC|nr:hypothetical protein [Pontibacter pamirensis]
MTPEEKERQRFINKIVSNARAIISNQVAIPLGVYKMNQIISWLEPYRKTDDVEVGIFRDYDLIIDDLPVGTERLQWNIEKLIEFENEFDETNKIFKADILRKCRQLIDAYSSDNSKKSEGKEE